MKMIPCERNDVPNGRIRKYSENFKILTEFVEGNHECAELLEFTQKNAKNCQTSLLASIRRYRFPTVGVMTREERVFLYKKKI